MVDRSDYDRSTIDPSTYLRLFPKNVTGYIDTDVRCCYDRNSKFLVM